MELLQVKLTHFHYISMMHDSKSPLCHGKCAVLASYTVLAVVYRFLLQKKLPAHMEK